MRLTRRTFLLGACAVPIAAKAAAVDALLPAPMVFHVPAPYFPLEDHLLDAMRYASISQRTALWATADMAAHVRPSIPLLAFRRIHVPYE